MNSIADIANALAEFSDRDLRELGAILNDETIAVPALSKWLTAALTWEINKRAGACRELHSPRITISGHSDVEASLVVLAVLQAQLRGVTGATCFLDATADALCTRDASELSTLLH